MSFEVLKRGEVPQSNEIYIEEIVLKDTSKPLSLSNIERETRKGIVKLHHLDISYVIRRQNGQPNGKLYINKENFEQSI